MRRDRLRVVDREIWFGDRVVGQLSDELWPTLVDAVTNAIDRINLAEATVPLCDFEDRVESLMREIERLQGELELRSFVVVTEPDLDFLQ